jgi:hypothetical protein
MELPEDSLQRVTFPSLHSAEQQKGFIYNLSRILPQVICVGCTVTVTNNGTCVYVWVGGCVLVIQRSTVSYFTSYPLTTSRICIPLVYYIFALL